jgi:hypothetical protein
MYRKKNKQRRKQRRPSGRHANIKNNEEQLKQRRASDRSAKTPQKHATTKATAAIKQRR